jgi:hypothetical protein
MHVAVLEPLSEDDGNSGELKSVVLNASEDTHQGLVIHDICEQCAGIW